MAWLGQLPWVGAGWMGGKQQCTARDKIIVQFTFLDTKLLDYVRNNYNDLNVCTHGNDLILLLSQLLNDIIHLSLILESKHS